MAWDVEVGLREEEVERGVAVRWGHREWGCGIVYVEGWCKWGRGGLV